MASDLQIIIDGYGVKELRCKNDICRKLIGYDNIKVGVFVYVCPNCQYISVFNMRYKEIGKEFISKLKQEFTAKGGEK
jgi:hypothetical protein